MDDYEKIYRRLHPKRFLFSPWERQAELRNLWPRDQQKFKKMVDGIKSPRKERHD